MLADVPARIIHQPGRYAVLLNARAKQWTGDLHEAVSRWVPKKDLFLSDDFHQAARTVDRLLGSDYDVIFTAGGDGTIVYLAKAVEERIREGKLTRETAPPIGVLKMGTGNAIASYLGCRDVVEDLRALSAGSPLVVYSVNMIETDGGLHPFVGFGWDALILNDYDAFKQSVRETPLENYATGLGGYAASIAVRSIPQAVASEKRHARITALGPAARVDAVGETIAEFEDGAVIFDGPMHVLAASSIPYWGFKIRMFPHCTKRPDSVQLRVYHGPIRKILLHLRRFWKGEFDGDTVSDFLIRGARVEILDGAMAYHVSGDPAGFERSVDWRVADFPAHFAVPLR